ncbi:alkaline phosphatase [Microthyrium microscopicum]|uniref:alkaline phosphatase n=1 Tax=Microthyrium microscopicum TaxID=703497 RepID=A0A6A6U1H3_9PEZI|nr:alkaline phosphatase [Microthyrium microscopicum]
MKFTIAIVGLLLGAAQGQTFQRLGTCPTFGCIFPPDQANFLLGQFFDIRLEVHAPVNGTEANGKLPDEKFTFTVASSSGSPAPAASFFSVAEPALERWNFTWYEDLFAQDAKTPSLVNVTSKAYRRVRFTAPGTYTATLNYNNGSTTKATWHVRDLPKTRRAKNVILFIGDGMTTNAITAARLIGHKMVNGYYQSKLALDTFPVIGHQMTHSIDSFITDSANSATALYTGHKSTVNALGVYADSSPNKFDDPKVETIAELFQRLVKGAVGIVSTAFLADATPAALVAHTRDRGQYGPVVDSFFNGVANYTWSNWTGVDVLFGGGAENFYNSSLGGLTYLNRDQYAEAKKKGYGVVYNNTDLQKLPNNQRALGVFSVSNMAKWLDRNVFTTNLKNQNNSADGLKKDAIDQPGLKEMTLKAIDIVSARSNGSGWFVMSEAASIDKMLHVLDYDRALGETLELDDTVRATIAKLKASGQLNDTLIIVTADHGHGFDVTGSVDTKYLQAQNTTRAKRNAVGVYQNAGLSQYVMTGNLTYANDSHFPSNWDPRYTLQQGVVTFPDRIEDYMVNKNGPRTPAVNTSAALDNYVANPKEHTHGILINGTLPLNEAQGVHSLTDVPVYAMGPGQELFGGTYNNIDIFYKIAEVYGLSGKGL